ncbi:MAG: hypothetical protein ABI164_09765 [Acidobacteriaceae bacterium]
MNDAAIPKMNSTGEEVRGKSEPSAFQEKDYAVMLLCVGGVADRAMVCRTQRRVREQMLESAERRSRARYGVGLTILAFSLLLLVLTPVVWGGFHLEQGWSFTDFDTQSMYMVGWLFPATLVALVLGCLRMRNGRGTRRIDHRVTSRLDSLVR